MARWDRLSRSGNVEDRRGVGSGIAYAGGGGIVLILLTLGLNFLGLDVSQTTVEQVLSQIDSFESRQVSQSEQPIEFRGDDDYQVFTERILGSTTAVWSRVFSENDSYYDEPRLVLFRGSTTSSCGGASAAIGPHYCPADATIYLDETFFEQLQSRFGVGTGEVAQAYVIAHEVGHHVQNLQGSLNGGVQSTREGSIAIELQADCYAGIWAYTQAKNNIFEGGEIDQAMTAAAAVGDDNIQRQTTGRISPESWTHGSSEQRSNAFNTGYTTGDPSRCTSLN